MLQDYLSRWSYRYDHFFPLHLSFIETDDHRVVNMLVARRVNLGCINNYCISVAKIGSSIALSRFADSFYCLDDEDCAEVKVFEDDVLCPYVCCQEKIDYLFPRYSKESFDIGCSAEEDFGEERASYSWKRTPQIDSESEAIDKLEEEKKELCDKIATLIADFVSKHHQMPPMDVIKRVLNGKVLLSDGGISPLVVNNNLDIILPSYNEVKIPLQALSKALYFLFLRHSEGIRLVDIDRFRDELLDLYGLVMPNRSSSMARVAIDNITNTVNNESLRQQISKIKRCFASKIIPTHLAEHYYISGSRSEEYLIPLDRKLVQLPEALL